MGRYSKAFSIKKQFQSPNCQTCQGQSRTLKKIVFLELFLRIIEDEKWNLFEKLGQLRTPIIVVCGVSLTLSTTALRSQPPHQLQVRGWPGATRPRTWFHLTQHFKLWVNYISLSAQVGILCVFLTLGREDDQKT